MTAELSLPRGKVKIQNAMPELPEVEYARRHLLRWLRQSPVISASASASRVFRGASRKAFRELRGKVVRIERRGKQLLLVFDNGALRSHLGMTGKWVERTSAKAPYSRAHFELENGHFIHYCDPRMFGRLQPTNEQSLAASGLGPDALTLGTKMLREALASTKLPIKVALMDQARIAGIGNIQACEALWRARIDPRVPARTLTDWPALARGIRATLRFTLATQAKDEIRYLEEAASDNPFRVYGRKAEACLRCKTPIATMTQGGRTTYYCPHCQRSSV